MSCNMSSLLPEKIMLINQVHFNVIKSDVLQTSSLFLERTMLVNQGITVFGYTGLKIISPISY